MDFKNLIPFGKKNLDAKRAEENPFAMMQREMNRIFDSFNRDWGWGSFPAFTGSFSPRMDIAENAKSFLVTAELPGMDEKDIDVSLAGDTLTIRGEKKDDREEKGEDYYYAERSYGSFNRSIPLPAEIDADKISASFKKGILTITLPKTAAAAETTKKIAVKTG